MSRRVSGRGHVGEERKGELGNGKRTPAYAHAYTHARAKTSGDVVEQINKPGQNQKKPERDQDIQ